MSFKRSIRNLREQDWHRTRSIFVPDGFTESLTFYEEADFGGKEIIVTESIDLCK